MKRKLALVLMWGIVAIPDCMVDGVVNEEVNFPVEFVMPHKTPEKDIQLVYPATLEPFFHTLLSTELNVRVVKIYKRMGDSFVEGEPLIQMDNVNLRATYLKAVAILEKAQTVFCTKERLFEAGIASYMDFVDAQAQLASAESDVTIALKNLTDSTIVAPYDGKVVLLNVEEDEYPLQEWHIKNKPIMEIINDKKIRAKVLIPSTLLKNVKIGDELTIRINNTGETTTGIISRIGVVMDPVSSTIPVEAEIDNRDGKLMGGMKGAATLKISRQKEPM